MMTTKHGTGYQFMWVTVREQKTVNTLIAFTLHAIYYLEIFTCTKTWYSEAGRQLLISRLRYIAK